MREFINIINEAFKPTDFRRTKSKDFELSVAGKENPLVKSDNNKDNLIKDLPGNTMSSKDALRKTSSINMTPDAAKALAHLSTSDIGDDEDDIPMSNSENLPAVIRKDLVVNDQDFDPKWIMVKDLPGYYQRPIKALGRQIFSQFTNTPIEKIQVLSTLTNSESDVRKMMAFISRRGIKDDTAIIDFDDIMPGVQADVQLWKMTGFEFLLVKDMMGYYIYAWPGGRGVHIAKQS